MKNILKKFIPPIILDYRALIGSYFCYAKNYKKIVRNKKFLDINKGRDLLIIGNGPSLNKVDLQKLKHLDMFACNDFYLHDDFNELNIKYYFNLDPREIWFRNMSKNIKKEKLEKINFFFSLSHKNRIDEYGEFIKNKNYIIDNGKSYYSYSNFLQIDRPTLHILNILQILLITGNYMGYKNIYLVGFDYSFLAYRNKSQVEHFHKGNNQAFKSKEEENQYGRMACSVCTVFNALNHIKRAVISSIYNLSYEDSFLDIFESLDVKEIYK